MWKWLRNAKFASAVGFCIVLILIWLVGPFIGLASRETRFAWSFCIMLIWVISLMAGRLLTERASGLLEKVLRHEANEAVIGAAPDKRAEVARLRQRLLAAIDTVKTSNLGKVRGKAALYELPWYMIIGHPAAGKSSAILHSGLNFPFGDKQAIQGVGGTRDCDWFFSTEGVLLDTAGRYSTQHEDRPEWLGFLKLLKKYRPKAPVNGIVVAISFPELIQFRSEQFAVYARQIRERINEIDNAFGIKVPVYLLFTKIDLLGGFAQFFESMSEDERHQVWGASLSHDQGGDYDAKRVVLQQFDALYRGLAQMGAEQLANNRSDQVRPALFAFPIEFNAMREPIGKFVELLFQEDPYHGKPLLRGFYFTSALQEGTPRIEAGARVSSQFDLARPGFDVAQLPASNGYFLRSLFRDVLFPDQYLVTRFVKPRSAHLRLAGILSGLLTLAVLAGMMTWSYIGNQKLIAASTEELAVAHKLSQSERLLDRLKALQVLQLRLEQLYAYRASGHPLSLGMTLYRGQEIERVMRAEYFAAVKLLMLEPIKSNLEQTLETVAASAGTHAEQRGPMRPAPATTPESAPAPSNRRPGSGASHSAKGNLPIIPIHAEPAAVSGPNLLRGAVLRFPSSPILWAQAPSSIAILRTNTQPALSPNSATSSEKGMYMRPVSEPERDSVRQPKDALEDGYNALKTYLMLNQKARMDAAHLSDQMPRYWRAWLAKNGGGENAGEINRLAERVVAFYVSQIGERDLPLIETQMNLVASTREALRESMHRLPANERVYNELKARANTQFAPMTVGRILNNNHLDLVAGSYAVPGAFTRQAWESYFRNAIAEASRGEIKGDDWVLASTTQEDLRKNGDAEHVRAELEALYKADYAREWKKFLQGIAIRDFGSMDVAGQALAKLADPQASAIKQIFVAAAFETSWDNPTAVAKTIESARNSVIERTEKLLLGSSPRHSIAETSARRSELGGTFSLLATLATPAGGDNARMPLNAYLDALAKVKAKMAQIASNSEPEAAARQLMQATLAGSGSELADALALVDGTLLANARDDEKEIVRPLLVRPLLQAYAALIPPTERGINRAWQAEVWSIWRGLASKYPFADAGNEASMAEIAKFLKPQEGVLPKFLDKQLAGLVVRRGDALAPRTWGNLGISFNPAFLNSVVRLSSAGSAVLQEGEGAKFELQPVPTPGLSEILIEVDGQTLRYRNGPQVWSGFSWPNPAAAGNEGARIQTVSFAGVSTSVSNFSGRLGFMRLLAQATVDNPGASTVQLEWRTKPRRNPPEKSSPAERGNASDSDSDVVRFNFRMVSGANPLALSGLRRLGLPEKITN